MHPAPPENDARNSHEPEDLDHPNLLADGFVEFVRDHEKPHGPCERAESRHEQKEVWQQGAFFVAPRNETKGQMPEPHACTEADATGKRVCWRRSRAVKIRPGSCGPEVGKEGCGGKQKETKGDLEPAPGGFKVPIGGCHECRLTNRA